LKPIIGITVGGTPEPENLRTGGRLILNWNYADAIASAGGVPVLIPPQADADAVAGILDGLLIPGGADIDPAEYGQTPHETVTELVSPYRYSIEKALFRARPEGQPYLGICYGCQFLNVQRGGTLEQHLVDRVHHEEDIHGTLQEYRIEAGSKLHQLVTERANGQSWHHQAVDCIGENLKVVGWNHDGTPEAIEDTSLPYMIGVQWHPERTLESPTSRALFESFIAAAAEYQRTK
jgi:putative glutamine amidotransferase